MPGKGKGKASAPWPKKKRSKCTLLMELNLEASFAKKARGATSDSTNAGLKQVPHMTPPALPAPPAPPTSPGLTAQPILPVLSALPASPTLSTLPASVALATSLTLPILPELLAQQGHHDSLGIEMNEPKATLPILSSDNNNLPHTNSESKSEEEEDGMVSLANITMIIR